MEIPNEVAGAEPLHRRIHPTFVSSSGRVSSQAFTDPELSVDRALYREPSETLQNCEWFGLVAFLAQVARDIGQEVRADKQLLNQAHALVVGKKTKSVARRLARSSEWIVELASAEGA